MSLCPPVVLDKSCDAPIQNEWKCSLDSKFGTLKENRGRVRTLRKSNIRTEKYQSRIVMMFLYVHTPIGSEMSNHTFAVIWLYLLFTEFEISLHAESRF